MYGILNTDPYDAMLMLKDSCMGGHWEYMYTEMKNKSTRKRKRYSANQDKGAD
jgi:hypothetical protein